MVIKPNLKIKQMWQKYILNSFIEIGPNLSRHVGEVVTPFEEFLNSAHEVFVFEKTTHAHVFSRLSRLCKSKATGLDNTSVKLLRECPELLTDASRCSI